MTVSEIVKAFGGPAQFGRACGFERNPASRGSDMRQRGSIPAIYWSRLVEAAKARGVENITLEILAAAHAEKAA